ncbi:hypothetical protein D5F01_LYC05946 [Larimichthys crocea]|uniref:Uncharacterized protein n=1 Tax=Larimichthys crocea TaxID=215358 RepID=A0A6G0IUR2_LARCR|nr:hypothetical protein D5F01_LYC05946 [Larimichthys crocea]
MPQMTVAYPKEKGVTGRGKREDKECKWMEEVKEDGEGDPADRQSRPNQTPAVLQLLQTSWSQTLRTVRPWKGWYSFALVGVVWSVCQVEEPQHPSLFLTGVCWRLLLVCSLWIVLGGCAHVLRCCLRPGQNQGEPSLRVQQEVMAENRDEQCSCTSQSRRPGRDDPLALALVDSLQLCVLQEPLSDPSVPHMKTLLFRLESVFHTLEKAPVGSEATPEGVDRDPALTDKLKLILDYLQQRVRSLCRLVQVQGDFETSVKDMLEGLDGLWAQLEELHTGVTLTKEGSRGHRDLDSAHTDTESLFAVLDHYRNRLQSCQTHLKDSTQLLQELTWRHAHMCNSVSCSSESVWPELLLQSNIEQFDKVQESFLSLEQQTSTFQAHLEGLGKENQEGLAGPLAQVNGPDSCSVSPENSPHLHSQRTSDLSLERRNSTSASTSSADADPETETDNPLTLCERSALQLSTTMGRLRKSGRKK